MSTMIVCLEALLGLVWVVFLLGVMSAAASATGFLLLVALDKLIY